MQFWRPKINIIFLKMIFLSEYVIKRTTFKVIIILVQEILQHVRPPNFEWFQSFYWYITLDFGHQGFFEKNNHLLLMFLIWKHKLSLLGLKNRWANMLINLLNQKNNGFKNCLNLLCQVWWTAILQPFTHWDLHYLFWKI